MPKIMSLKERWQWIHGGYVITLILAFLGWIFFAKGTLFIIQLGTLGLIIVLFAVPIIYLGVYLLSGMFELICKLVEKNLI